MRSTQRFIAAILAGAILGLLSPASVTTAAAEPEWLPEVADSATIAGPVVARGKLAQRLATARITLVAWPTSDVLAAAEDGDTVKPAPVGKAVAAGDGAFILRVDPTAPIAQFMEADGTVNFELAADAADGSRIIFAFPRWFDREARAWRATPEDAVTGDLTINLDGAASVEGLHAEAPPAVDKACTTTVVATYNTRLGIVGEVYTGPNASGDLEYINGASSTLGVGVSSTGAYGSFSASGTSGQSSTWTENYPTQGQNKLTVMRTNWGYKKYKEACTHCGTGGCASWTTYRVRAYQYQGGQNMYTAASAPTANYCVSYVKGGSTTKDSGTAITFTNGVKLGSVIGIDLSTKTGFNANTKIKFNWINAGRLCGTNDYPPQAARVVGK